MLRVIALSLALPLALTLAAPAAAQPRTLMVAAIPLDDLDLGTQAGAAAMLRRLDHAARQICDFTRTPVLPREEGRAWRCRRDAISAAVERLNAPRLTVAWATELSAEASAYP